MLYKCDRYPELLLILEDREVGKFKDGLFETDNEAVVLLLETIPEVSKIAEEVKTPSKGKKKD